MKRLIPLLLFAPFAVLAAPALAASQGADVARIEAGDVNAFAAAELAESVRGLVQRPVVPFDLPLDEMGRELPARRQVNIQPVTTVVSPRRGDRL